MAKTASEKAELLRHMASFIRDVVSAAKQFNDEDKDKVWEAARLAEADACDAGAQALIPQIVVAGTDDLDKLQDEAKKLVALLEDRQTGLHSWWRFLAIRLEAIHKLATHECGGLYANQIRSQSPKEEK